MENVWQQLFTFQGIIVLVASAVIALLLIALLRKFSLLLSWIIVFLLLFLGGLSLYDNQIASHLNELVNPTPKENKIAPLGERLKNVWERVKEDLQVLSSKVKMTPEKDKGNESVAPEQTPLPQ